VTHQRNRTALTRAEVNGDAVMIPESRMVQVCGSVAGWMSEYRGHINWPIRHALSYPVYAQFNRRVFHRFRQAVEHGNYDVVHAFSPILPRYPVKMIQACRDTPFVLGPVNGGLTYPPGFKDVEKKEFGRFLFLRDLARFLPGYKKTYQRADKLLAGSSATMGMLRRMLSDTSDRIELLYENAVLDEFLVERCARNDNAIRLLFVGRLVPCKCAEVVIEALPLLSEDVRKRATLTIVGDGPERETLQRTARKLNLETQVHFAGWVPQRQTVEFYRQSDIFCFPSVREFGGAVVLEAMAAGLPCIVADYGGISEYVTEATGFKIGLQSREQLGREMALRIEQLARDRDLRARMSAGARQRAREFTWQSKAHRTVDIYANLIEQRQVRRGSA
jgi:glycosyltransferase involved in cell wall biosynthesis